MSVPPYDVQLIQTRIETLRKALLELGMGNPLLHFPFYSSNGKLKSKRLEVRPSSLDALYQNLLSGKKAVIGSSDEPQSAPPAEPLLWGEDMGTEEEFDDWGAEDDFHAAAPQVIVELGRSEFELRVHLGVSVLEARLLELMRNATGLIEESGVNGFFLGLGRIEWYEAKKPGEPRLAPLILIPVQLERDLKRKLMRLVYNGEEIQLNSTLEVKLASPELALKLPWETVGEDFTPSEYLDQVSQFCQHHPHWRVHQDAYLGFFSPSKIGLYRELDAKNLQGVLNGHPLLGPLLGRGPDQALSVRQDIDVRDPVLLTRSRHVLDADSSQAEAVWRTALGEHLVLEGPPGTGKSQTITNIIATAVAQGKRVLFVAEKEAALNVVEDRLKRVGLGDPCLALHSKKANKKGVRDSLKSALEAARKRSDALEPLLDERQELTRTLENYAQAIGTPVGSSHLSAYDLYGSLLALDSPEVRSRPFRFLESAQWDDATLERATARVAQLEALLAHAGPPQHLPHWGSARMIHTSLEDEQLESLGQATTRTLDHLQLKAQSTPQYGFAAPQTLGEWRTLKEEWTWLRNAPDLSGISLERALWSGPEAAGFVSLSEHSEVQQRFAAMWRLKLGAIQANLTPLKAHLLQAQPYDGLGLEQLERETQNLALLNETLTALQTLAADLGRFKLEPPSGVPELTSLLETLKTLSSHDYSALTVKSHRWLEEEKQLTETLEAGWRQAQEIQARGDALRPEVWDADLIGLRQVLEGVGSKWYRFFSAPYRAAVRVLKRLYVRDLPSTLEDQLQDLDKLLKIQADRQRIQRTGKDLLSLYGHRWKGLTSDWEKLTASRAALTDQLRAVQERRAPRSTLDLLEALSQPDVRLDLLEACDAITRSLQSFTSAQQATTSLLTRFGITDPTVSFQQGRVTLTAQAARHEERKAFMHSLSALFETPIPWGVAKQQTLLEQLEEYQAYVRLVLKFHPWASSALGTQWRGLNSNFESLGSLTLYLIQTLTRSERVWQVLLGPGKPALEFSYFELDHLEADLRAGMDALLSWLEMTQDALPSKLDEFTLDTLKGQVRRWSEDRTALSQTVAFNQCKAALEQAGLGEVWMVALRWEAAATHLKVAFEFSAFERLLERAFAEHPALAQFNRHTFTSSIERFRALDTLLLERNALAVLSQYQERLPALSGLGQMRIIEGELLKQRKLLPIRKLMQDAGQAIKMIKPVFMMSPLSIASFLPLGALEFDLVLFDEASQVRPELGLGALLRSKQAVVVGDSNQMGPSSGFGGGLKNVSFEDDAQDDDSRSIKDNESLLDLFSSQFSRFKSRLSWHYRSQHESLIATSNAAFYEGELVTFPAAVEKPGELGLVFHHLPDTVYIPSGGETGDLAAHAPRGLKAVNQLEAEAIVRAAMQHAMTRPFESLAVVAFSAAQQKMIYTVLERLQPVMTAQQKGFLFPDENAPERFVVKNLENVQGDERDVIYISVGYGRTARGKVVSTFGTLNRSDGWRSLNVLITRAKKRCEVFVNFMPEEIPNLEKGRDGQRGLRVFANFLMRARAASQPGSGSELLNRAAPQDLSSQIATLLEARGYQVARQVGTSQDRIDLAVRHPERHREFILGILCDSSSYTQSRWSRDRDRIRPQVLAGMGWQIYRVWSTDWYRDPLGEQNRLLEHLRGILRGEFERPVEDFAPSADLADWTEQVEPTPVFDFDPDPEEFETLDWGNVTPPTVRFGAAFAPYQTSPLRIHVTELHSVATHQMVAWLVEIVNFEGPLHRDQLARRLLEAAGVRKLGSRIQSAIDAALRHALTLGPSERGLRQEGQFFSRGTAPVLRSRSALPPTEKVFEFISDPELEQGLTALVDQAIGIEREELAVSCSRAFGFERTTQEIRSRLEMRIDALLESGQLLEENDFLSRPAAQTPSERFIAW